MKLSAVITFLCVVQSFKTSYRSVLHRRLMNLLLLWRLLTFLDFNFTSLQRLLFQNSSL